MQIAPGYSTELWKSLHLDDPNSSDWTTAIKILEGRIFERFIEPIDCLIAAEAEKPAHMRRFGFTVLAVDCLLVETLGAFIDGSEDTEGISKSTFCKFLTNRPLFFGDFTEDVAKQFYKEFRCGILHQAEIGGDSKVWSVGPLIQIDGGRIIVNRNKFHEQLKKEFKNYLLELQTPINVELRKKFRKKMDFISRS